MLVLISIIRIFPSIFCINFFIIITSTINQPESRLRRNCQPITRASQDVVRFNFLFGLTKIKATLSISTEFFGWDNNKKIRQHGASFVIRIERYDEYKN